MRWVRTVVLVILLASTMAVTAPSAHAAPLTGVTFVGVQRVADSVDLAAGTYQFSLPAPPSGATQALVNIGIMPPDIGSKGVVMVHDCSVAADPSTDVVLPMENGPGFITNEVFAPVSGGLLCVTTTAHTSRFILDLVGWVASTGAAYVDLPFNFVTTVAGRSDGTVIDLAAFGVPSDATGVAVWLDVLSTTAGFVTLYPCDQPRPLASQGNWVADVPTTILVAGVPTVGAQLCIFISDGASVDISIDGYYGVNASPSATSPPQVRYHQQRAPGFVGTSPKRLFDTRTAGVPIVAGQEHRLDLTPYVPIDTTAVVMNVTVTDSSGSGFISVYPCDSARPVVSSLNYGPGQTVPNLVAVDTGSTLEVCFFASATTHLLADLAGYYVDGAGDGFTPSAPVRMFDTRNSTKLAAGSVFEFDLSPYVAPDASAAVFNLTATEVQGSGYITAYPCGAPPPLASNLNVSAGQTVPNLVTVALPANKHVCFFTLTGTHLLADLTGWYAPSAASGFVAITPTRWIDTRDDSATPLPAGLVNEIFFGPYFPDATAMVFNATVTEPATAGFLTAFPCSPTLPTVSNVNFVSGQTVPNMVISAVDPVGSVCLFNSTALHWIVDVGGFFTDAPVFVDYFPDGTDIL